MVKFVELVELASAYSNDVINVNAAMIDWQWDVCGQRNDVRSMMSVWN